MSVSHLDHNTEKWQKAKEQQFSALVPPIILFFGVKRRKGKQRPIQSPATANGNQIDIIFCYYCSCIFISIIHGSRKSERALIFLEFKTYKQFLASASGSVTRHNFPLCRFRLKERKKISGSYSKSDSTLDFPFQEWHDIYFQAPSSFKAFP